MPLAGQVERASRDARDRREVADLREALAVAVSALGEAERELGMIATVEQPTPQRLERMLERGEAAEAVLKRILRAAPPERKRRLGEMCRHERDWTLTGGWDSYRAWEWRSAGELGPGTVLPEVTAALASAREQLRRLRTLSPAVRDVLDEGGWE